MTRTPASPSWRPFSGESTVSDRSDIDRLKARLSVETVLTELGAVFPGAFSMAQEQPFFCPFCDDVGSSKPAGRANDLEGVWHCWACNRGGDVITAVMEGKGLPFIESMQWLMDQYPEQEVFVDPWANRQGAS